LGLLASFAAFVDRLTERIGRWLAALVWLIAAVCAVVVGLRYAFHVTFTWMQELYVWIHAVVFLLGAPVAMKVNAHVRVDVLQARWSVKTRAAVEIAGTLAFTLLWIGVLAWLAWPLVTSSWAIREGSPQPNGMPGVYLLKSMLLVFAALLALQAAATIARGVLVLAGDADAARVPPFAKPGEPHP